MSVERFRRQHPSAAGPGKRAFISYSRQDKTFVEALVDDLQKHEINVWIDRSDILPTAEWMAEIEDGIRRSDNFVFVISPDSVESPICLAELAHAERHNKRIVLLLHRTVEPSAVPDSIRIRQWLDGDDHDALMHCLTSDPDCVRLHSRILTQAWEWQSLGRSRSALLRGKDLHRAQQWLDHDTEDDPRPTELQRGFLRASRAASRQRVAAGTVATAVILVVAVVLGITMIRTGHAGATLRSSRARTGGSLPSHVPAESWMGQA